MKDVNTVHVYAKVKYFPEINKTTIPRTTKKKILK